MDLDYYSDDYYDSEESVSDDYPDPTEIQLVDFDVAFNIFNALKDFAEQQNLPILDNHDGSQLFFDMLHNL